ncbi:uncharacterized protein [Dermacentor andersoni]|uniref:uncharacterized protein n=1 Tax=Dermacentor andersoni TaxID=34620 RepID=UPI002155ADAD|nr:uncharacterized protein LOC126542000 [Dermacentor andersoni]
MDVALAATTPLAAVFNSAGVRGSVDVEPLAAAPHGVSVRASLVGGQPRETFRWAVHRLPPRHDSSAPCAYDWIGEPIQELTDEFGQLTSEQETRLATKTQFPVEPRQWAGRALVLHSVQTGRTACAALQPPGAPVTTYAARFTGPPIAGTLFVRRWPSFGTVYAELHWTNGTRRDAQVRWSIHKRKRDQPTRLQQPPPGTSAANLTHVMPPNVPRPPTVVPCYTPPESCSQVSVGKRPGNAGTRAYHVLEGVPPALDTCGGGDSASASELIATLEDVATGQPMAAAVLHEWRSRHAVADLGPRHGKAIFHQPSPFEPTLSIVQLENLDYVASKLLIGPISIGTADKQCPGPAAPYNPAKVERTASPPEGHGTTDQFPVGDLSGKYGPVAGHRAVYWHLLDPTLPLSGHESVVGRMLLVRGSDGRPLVCANLLPVSARPLTRVRATLEGPLRGSVTITRADHAEDPLGDAYVDLGLCWQDGRNGSVDHNWHLHSVPLAPGSFDCAATKGHYNPHRVDTGPAYGCECSAHAPLRCEAGDLAGRQGAVSIPDCRAGLARYHFADSHVSLSGPTSVIGLPVVFHESHFRMPRVACANLKPL